jgi:signal transduction histidine kinase
MRDSLKGLQVASRKITRLVEDFIFLAEIRTGEAAGSFYLSSRPTNASLVLLEASDLIRPVAERQGTKVECQLSMELPNSKIDYDRFKAGIQRLLILLIDYCALYQRGSVLVQSSSEVGEVNLSLGINGIGFTNDKYEQINSLLSQTDIKGTELSENEPDLVVAKGIIDLHNGKIRLENEPGQSARFVISLPVFNR